MHALVHQREIKALKMKIQKERKKERKKER
jgi:hypothetical protein